jgi:hypothetical protein
MPCDTGWSDVVAGCPRLYPRSKLLFILLPGNRHDRGQPVAGVSVAGKDKTVHDMNNMNISEESKDGWKVKVRTGRSVT